MRPYFIVFTVFAIFIAIVTWFGNISDFTVSDAANWVQALGTIFAIFSGYLLINYEQNKALDGRIKQRKRGILNFCKLAQFISTTIINNINVGLERKINTSLPREVNYLASLYGVWPTVKFCLSEERKLAIKTQYQQGLQYLTELEVHPVDILSFTAIYEEIAHIDENITQISNILNNSRPSKENCSKVERLLRDTKQAKVMIDNHVKSLLKK